MAEAYWRCWGRGLQSVEQGGEDREVGGRENMQGPREATPLPPTSFHYYTYNNIL